MKLFILLFAGTLLYSCSNSKKIIEEEISSTTEEVIDSASETVSDAKPERNVKIKAEIGEFTDSDLFEIKSAKIVGNSLFMVVTFSGGCAEHNFDFIGSPMVMKSLPAKRSVKLIHDKNDDSCRSIVTKTLEIDLKNIAYKQTTGSELVLLLDGWKGELKYTFV